MKTGTILVGATLIVAGLGPRTEGGPAAGQARAAAPAAKDHAADEKAIGALVAAFAKAFDAGDAQAAAATFAEDALVVDEEGERAEGRAAIREQFAAGFAAAPGRKIAIKTEALRFLGPDTALEEGKATITPADGGPAESSKFTVVYVRRDGHWLQAAVRDEKAGEPTPHDRLRDLEWLVGDWVNESQDAVVHTVCKWSEDGNFLVREFTMKTSGQPVLSGSQRIGWDPARGQFRTWIFDSEGGFGEGLWSRDGDRWTIKIAGIRPDGKHVSATNIITRLGKGRLSWESTDRTLGEAAMPGIDAFTLVRQPPKASK